MYESVWSEYGKVIVAGDHEHVLADMAGPTLTEVLAQPMTLFVVTLCKLACGASGSAPRGGSLGGVPALAQWSRESAVGPVVVVERS